jgi:hypothetical protein
VYIFLSLLVQLKVCTPYSKGGLGLRSLIKLNEASNLKLCWDLLHSEASWVKVLTDRVLGNGKPINHHISSSLWSSIKSEFNVIMDNSSWQLGSGQNILLWEDAWCGEPLKDRLHINETLFRELPGKVCDLIHNRSWLIP